MMASGAKAAAGLLPPYDYLKVAKKDAFSTEALFRYPEEELSDAVKSGRLPGDLSVCIVGAGIAGLTAAYEIVQRTNWTVTVLEADAHPGGRIRTHRFATPSAAASIDNGSYGELGAMRVPIGHTGVLHYINALGLDVRPFVMENLDALYHFKRWQRHKLRDYKQLKQYFTCSDKIWERPPGDFLAHALGPWRDEVFSPAGWDAFRTADGQSSRVNQFDRITVWQVFCDTRIREKILGIRPRGKPRLTPEEWDYIGRTEGTLWVERGTLLGYLLEEPGQLTDSDAAMRQPDEQMLEVCGGMRRLVDGMVDAIQAKPENQVITGAAVDAIDLKNEESKEKTRVHWRSDRHGRQSAGFDRVICTVPAKATLDLDWEIHDDDRQALYSKLYALSNLTSDALAKSLVWYSKRWWELNGADGAPRISAGVPAPIAGGASYTDLQIQQCWYPSDNASRVSKGEYKPRDMERSRGPGVLTVYMWGHNARRFAALDSAERDEWVISRLELMHGLDMGPNTHHGHRDLIEGIEHIAWDTVTNPSGGAVTYFGPGERERYQSHLCEPLNCNAHQAVYFAGEHLGVLHGWMQSAVSSAHGATIALIQGAVARGK